jgi:hyperosmotically inducible protein
MTGRGLLNAAGSLLAAGLLSATLVAQTVAATRYDSQIQTSVAEKLAKKSQFSDVKSSIEDGIVTLTGTVDLYQRKLDAAKLARKTASVQGVDNLITVAGPNVPDEQLERKLAQKLNYVREGYDSTFDYFALGVKDGIVTVEGQDLTGLAGTKLSPTFIRCPG